MSCKDCEKLTADLDHYRALAEQREKRDADIVLRYLRQRDEAVARAERLERENARLWSEREAITRVHTHIFNTEWVEDRQGNVYCPWCGADKGTEHRAFCITRHAALAPPAESPIGHKGEMGAIGHTPAESPCPSCKPAEGGMAPIPCRQHGPAEAAPDAGKVSPYTGHTEEEWWHCAKGGDCPTCDARLPKGPAATEPSK